VGVEEFELDSTGRSQRAAPMGIHDGTRIARYGESFPDTFAGRWKEPDDSWVVGFTDEVDHHSAAIRKLVYAPDNVRVVQFRFSYRHLLTVRDRIVDILGTKEGLMSWDPTSRITA
jgi:hypothetical protein